MRSEGKKWEEWICSHREHVTYIPEPAGGIRVSLFLSQYISRRSFCLPLSLSSSFFLSSSLFSFLQIIIFSFSFPFLFIPCSFLFSLSLSFHIFLLPFQLFIFLSIFSSFFSLSFSLCSSFSFFCFLSSFSLSEYIIFSSVYFFKTILQRILKSSILE